MDGYVEVARMAAVQHGLVERSQVLAGGVSASALQRMVAARRLDVVQTRVYRAVGAPPTWEQRLLAAVLCAGPGAVASHRSAARLWGLADHEEVEVTTPVRRGRRPTGAVVHFSADLAMSPPVRRRGVPTVDPMRALVDLGAVVPRAAVEDALDRALERRLVTVEGVERALEVLARRGRPGAGVLRAVLDERALGAARPDSLLEPRMARLLGSWSLPPAVFQHEVRDHRGRFVARVDFAYRELAVAIEVDGWASHSSPRALQSDLDRQNALVGLGWTVARYTWHDVVRRPAKVADGIRHLVLRATAEPRTSTSGFRT